MKSYLIFAGESYYPGGGFEDWRGDAETVEDAVQQLEQYATDRRVDWWHIVEVSVSETGFEYSVVRKGGRIERLSFS